MDHYFLIYLLVCVAGNFPVACVMLFMRWMLRLPIHPIMEWKGVFVGFTERAVALTLVVWAPRYLVTFVGGWVLLKFAIGWQRTPLNRRIALGSLLALIANVISFAVAIAGGLYLNQGAIAYFGASGPG